MPLVARPKAKAYHRKRQAQHHRQSKRYVKTYLPYLPMFAIVAAGGVINEVWTVSSGVALAAPANSSLSTTRLAIITHSRSYAFIYVVLAITFVAFAIFLLTHWYRFHRLLNRGEAFMVHHPWLDVSLVFVVTAGVVLTRR